MGRVRRTSKKPPKGMQCDAHIGVDPNSRQPRVLRCDKPATVELVGAAPVGESWLCEDHADAILNNEEEASRV